MSIDAGGLAQMTYNGHNPLGGLGMPGSGFASRGKGGNIKRLSVPPPANISTIDENQPAPRTSRSHLLAGLRTAPKSPAMPTSAPPTQLQQPGSLNDSRYAKPVNNQYQQQDTPKTATAPGFANSYHNQQYQHNNLRSMNQFYSPEQVLAPPSIQIGEDFDDAQMDPQVYDELLRTNQYLAQQQARLQKQLIDVTAAAQQFQNLNLGQGQDAHLGQMGMNPAMGFYNQQLAQGMQPIVQPVPGQPGLYTVYNPMTGQASFVYDQGPQAATQHVPGFELSHSPPPSTPTFRSQGAPVPQSPSPLSAMNNWRSNTPPKTTPSPPREDAVPLPPPSANAFRPSHRKNISSIATGNQSTPTEGPKTAGLRSTFPGTPLAGTFGPGQAREGEHPIRQPRGPPSLDELIAKPTNKCEGSKNFASRQRRGALNHLVRAGIERREARDGGSVGSTSPTSEQNITFSVSSDNDNISVRSGSASLEGQPESGTSSRPVSAIGSERKQLRERSRERNSSDGQVTTISMSSDDENYTGGKFVEVRADAFKDIERRKSPLLVLANAEKRRSLVR